MSIDESSVSPPVAEDEAVATVVVALRGELDDAARAELEALLESLAVLPQPVWLDVSAAWSTSRSALRTLLRFRETRWLAGLSCRLCGLHDRIAVELADADLADVFAVWTDTVHDDGPRTSPR